MFPPVTLALIVANVSVFLLEMAAGDELQALALWPLGPQFHPWQLLTYAFLHGNPPHIFFNMFALYMFGADVERLWGPWRFVFYYFFCVLAAALSQLTVLAITGLDHPTIGASGGVFGLLLAFALYFPNRIVILLFPPIPMPAWLFATVFGVLELIFGMTGTAAGVAHFAHLGGMLGGYIVIRFWRRRRGRS